MPAEYSPICECENNIGHDLIFDSNITQTLSERNELHERLFRSIIINSENKLKIHLKNIRTF